MLRMRQVCLVARDLDAVTEDFEAVLDLHVAFRDPSGDGVGIRNIVQPLGTGFVEVVSPIREHTTSGRYLDRRGGDGGYMVIMQCDSQAWARSRVESLAIRLVGDLGESDWGEIQLHPKDVPGAISALHWQDVDAANPRGPWAPAGDDWPASPPSRLVQQMVATEIQAADPPALAARWGEVIERAVEADDDGHPTIALDDASLRFVEPSDGRGEGISGLDITTLDRDALLARADERGCRVNDETVMVCGMRFRLVD